MSQDKNICTVNLQKGMLVKVGNVPQLKQGNKAPYTQFSVYNQYMPACLNPIKVSVFGELAKKVCAHLKEGDTIRVRFDQLAFTTITVDNKTAQTRPYMSLIMKDYELVVDVSQSETEVTVDQTIIPLPIQANEVLSDQQQQIKAACALLARNGVKIAG